MLTISPPPRAMPLPQRPEASESPTRNSPRRPRAQDEEAGYPQPSPTRSHRRGHSKHLYGDTLQSPSTPTGDSMLGDRSGASELGRKRSLIRPERNRIDRDHPNYHYRQHAANMDVLPSSTGNDPILEELEVDQVTTETSGLRTSDDSDISTPRKREKRYRGAEPEDISPTEKIQHKGRSSKKLTRETTHSRKMTKEEKQRQRDLEVISHPVFGTCIARSSHFGALILFYDASGSQQEHSKEPGGRKWASSVSFSLS